GAKLALDLASDPNRFLPTVQVGITLIGTFAAAIGGASLQGVVAEWLGSLPVEWIQKRRSPIALALVVVAITYLSVVVGELVPKRLALRNANLLARFVSLPMHWLAIVARPAVWCMARSTDAVLWLFGVRGEQAPSVSVEDIQHLIETGTQEGLLAPVEQQLA